MKMVQYAVCGLLLCALAPPTLATPPASEKKRIVIAASTVLDGRGGVLYDTRIVVEGSRIVAIDSKGVAWLDRLACPHQLELWQGRKERRWGGSAARGCRWNCGHRLGNPQGRLQPD